MKYFQVVKQTLVGNIVEGDVDMDGEYLRPPTLAETDKERDLDYTVVEYDETGITRTVTGLSLEQIKDKYSIDNGWQNNDW